MSKTNYKKREPGERETRPSQFLKCTNGIDIKDTIQYNTIQQLLFQHDGD